MKPLISVALPVYNGADYLAEAIETVLAQDFPAFELVVSDNCSTDRTPEILRAYADRDPRVRVHRSETFLAQAENVNRAASLCSAEFVKFMCHDDHLRPDCLSTLWKALESTGSDRVGLIGHGTCYLFDNGYHDVPARAEGVDPVALWDGPRAARSVLQGSPPPAWPALTNAMVRKSAWEAVGRFDPRFAHFDVFCWIQMVIESDFLSVNEPLATIRIHGAQVASNVRRNLRSVEDHRQFWPEYLARYGDRLGLDTWCRARTRLKPLSVVGTAIAVELLKHRPRTAWNLIRQVRPTWWPLLPGFIALGYRREWLHRRRYAQTVPYDLVVP